MKRFRVDEVTEILPELEELRPLRSRLIASAVPDPSRAWSASGELGTLGDRLVSSGSLEGAPEELAEAARAHLESVYAIVKRAVEALEADDRESAALELLEASALEERARRMGRAERYAVSAERALGGGGAHVRAQVLRRLGRIRRGQGRLEEGARSYERAHELADATGESRLAATAAIGRGNIAVDRGVWDEADRWYARAERILEKADVTSEHWQAALDRSIVARRKGDLEASRRHLERAEEIAGALGDADAKPILENGWGMLHRARGRQEEARARFESALSSAVDPEARVTIGVNLGECLLDLGDVLGAGERAREAEEVALAEDVHSRLPEVYRLLGRVAGRLGHEDAFVLFERALELGETLGLPEFERAQTLEAYGMAEAGGSRNETARQLLEAAAETYRMLGDREAEARSRSRKDAL